MNRHRLRAHLQYPFRSGLQYLTTPDFILPSPPLQSLPPHAPVMCRYTLGWLLFHDRLLLPGAETYLIVNIWAITIAN